MNEHDSLKLAARPFGLAAALALVFMMLFTTVTVSMRQLLDWPVLGVVDVMELALVVMIFLSLPGVFLRDENVTVDVIDQFVSRRIRVALRLAGLAITLAFLLVIFVPMIPHAMQKFGSGETTMTLGINRFIHWIPILIGFVGAILGVAWVLARYIRHGVPRDPTLDVERIE